MIGVPTGLSMVTIGDGAPISPTGGMGVLWHSIYILFAYGRSSLHCTPLEPLTKICKDAPSGLTTAHSSPFGKYKEGSLGIHGDRQRGGSWTSCPHGSAPMADLTITPRYDTKLMGNGGTGYPFPLLMCPSHTQTYCDMQSANFQGVCAHDIPKGG